MESEKQTGKFLIKTENVSYVIDNIRSKVDENFYSLRMNDKKVTRVIFRMPFLEEDESRWLRILIGDVDCHGKTGVTITYKMKNTKEGQEKRIPVLRVEEFDPAIDFFEAMGFVRTSTQENRRSKLFVTFEGTKYMIRFDIWPLMEELTFVTVEEVAPTDPRSKTAFISLIELSKYDISEGKVIDVDGEYKKRLGFRASDIPKLYFGLDIKKQFNENKTKILESDKQNLLYLWLNNEWSDAQKLYQSFKKSKRTLDDAISLMNGDC